MSKPRDTLKTKCDECVLEKFFYEYITVWFQNKAINAVTYDKARKEVDLLTGKKKGKKGKTENSNISAKNDVLEVQKLGANGDKNPHQNAKLRSMPSKPETLKGQPTRMQPKSKDTEPRRGQQDTYSKEERDIQHVIFENIELKNKIEKMKEKLAKVRADADVEMYEKDKKLDRLKKALENARTQVEELTFRLSKLAGDKLRQGNPDLADLSDANRPTELGKKFSEMYDNEWSDAFESITIAEEERRVGILHGIVTKAFSFCEQKYEGQTSQIKAILLGLPQETIPLTPDGNKTVRTIQIQNTLKDIRKQMSTKTAENVANEFLAATVEQYISGFGVSLKKAPAALPNYARKCAELCWLMVVCDPPMALSEDKEGIDFDTNVYRPYTLSVRDMKRPVVKQHVWPALYLHESGPLVAKGVSQPCEGKQNRSDKY